jgi:ribonuclease Z
MTSSVRILTTQTLDSSPAVLLLSPDGSKTIVNCGEGCQRAFLEYSQKLSTVNRIALTHLTHESIGGLPGMILTTADVAAAAMENAKAALGSKKKEEPECQPGLDLIGPTGTKQFIHSLRHFMRREKFDLRIQEGACYQTKKEIPKKQKPRKGQPDSESFHLQSIAFRQNNVHSSQHTIKRPRIESSSEVLSFIFTTPPILGKFQIDKAKALGIPPGPMYAQLKSGKDLTFKDKQGNEKTVQSCEVVEPGSPGVAVAVLYYPSWDVLDQIKSCEVMTKLSKNTSDQPALEVIVHMAPHNIFHSDACRTWRQDFASEVEHIFLETNISLESFQNGHNDHGTPFQSAAIGARARSQLCSSVYRVTNIPEKKIGGGQSVLVTDDTMKVVNAKPMLEYIVIPRGRKGFCDGDAVTEKWRELKSEADDLVESSGAASSAMEILSKTPTTLNGKCELLFTGTGSAMPCKHRNVSGISLRMDNGNSILLDVGEGTTGQILRASHGQSYDEVLAGIKAVWISHPHADHHLGILRLLTERHSLVSSDPLLLIAPPNLLRFLEEYEQVDPRVSGTYLFLDCADLMPNVQQSTWPLDRIENHQAMMRKLQQDLGVTSCTAVPVTHCRHAYAVILQDTSFGTVAYSGDCRPSMTFAKAALNADLLIHEATFEDGMEAEANVKRHCTVGEALDVAKNMQAKAIVLTHFSQRYPRIPPLKKTEIESAAMSSATIPIIFAFDFATFSPGNLLAASRLTPALRLLYPEDDSGCEPDQTVLSALEVPGLFAQTEIL